MTRPVCPGARSPARVPQLLPAHLVRSAGGLGNWQQDVRQLQGWQEQQKLHKRGTWVGALLLTRDPAHRTHRVGVTPASGSPSTLLTERLRSGTGET